MPSVVSVSHLCGISEESPYPASTVDSTLLLYSQPASTLPPSANDCPPWAVFLVGAAYARGGHTYLTRAGYGRTRHARGRTNGRRTLPTGHLTRRKTTIRRQILRTDGYHTAAPRGTYLPLNSDRVTTHITTDHSQTGSERVKTGSTTSLSAPPHCIFSTCVFRRSTGE